MENINIEDSDSEENKPIKKEKKKTGKKANNSESDEEMITQPQKGGFALLMDDAGDSLPSEDSAEEEAVVAPKKSKDRKVKKPAYDMLDQDGSEESDDGDKPSKEKKKKKKGKDEDKEEFKDDPPKGEKGGKKKKKKKGKKDDDDDEDLDAMLAALRSEYSGEPVPEGTATEEQVDGKKEKKKKGKKDEIKDEAGDLGFEVIDDEEVGGTVKTAAQKKKEKKERQMQKAREEREASKGKDVSVEKEVLKKQESVEKEDTPVPDGPVLDGEENEDGEVEGKKGKKKKGKKDKEEDDKKKKKPNKAVLAAMQEALAKQKDEEERLKQEEEEKERLAEEAFQAKIEAKRKEEEKKAAKKEREKQKKAELKAAGKLLTPAQKQAKLRAEAMLEAMRAQGVDVPAVGEKRPRPGTRKRMNQKNKQTGKEASPEDDSLKEATPEEETKVEDKVEEETKEEVVAESWDAVEDVKDAWDADSDKEVEADVKNPPIEEKVEEPEVSEDDESDEDGSDEESEEESSSEEEEEEEEDKTLAEKKRERAIARIKKRMADNEAARSVDQLRAPVVCVLGHVDTGKTKILDKLRRTNVQDGEAGGITQQIGATNVPISVIQEQCKMVQGFLDSPLRLPGLLIIDTPGHESFSNLRDRGSSLCDIAILVVDIMHGLEPQTIESLNLLKKKKTPFVVALNKVDRLYEWKPNRHKDIENTLKRQTPNTLTEFNERVDQVKVQFAEQGLNAALFYENPDPEDYISLVPTSAHSGDGMGNLMASLVEMSQTFLAKRLSYTEELQATVLEVKAIGGFGTTIDIVLVNGRLKFGQTIVLAGTDGPIVTTVKALLTPAKMQDLRVKNQYIEHKEIVAAQGVKIAARELEKTIAGLSMRVAHNPDELEVLKEAAERDLASALNAIKLKPLGVFVQASTLGSLEALLEFLKTSKIPYAGVRIGPVVRKDVMRASTMS